MFIYAFGLFGESPLGPPKGEPNGILHIVPPGKSLNEYLVLVGVDVLLIKKFSPNVY